MTKKEVLERIREIAHGDEAPQKEEVDSLKAAFYKLHIAEREARLKEYIDGGGDPEQYPTTVQKYGNTSSASIAILLDELVRANKISRGDLLVMSGFGAGFTTGSLLMEY